MSNHAGRSDLKMPAIERLWAVACFSLASVACFAQGYAGSTLPSAPAQARIDPQLVRLPVTDGSDLRFVRLSRSRGLSQQRVTHIVQDARGFLWFGTQFGLDRYDGYRFRVFKHEPEKPESLCDVVVATLFVDHAGAV